MLNKYSKGSFLTNSISHALQPSLFNCVVPLMKCISPFDNGLYHMATIRTNRTNRHLGQGFLNIQHVKHIRSPANEMHFSIQEWVDQQMYC